MMFALIAAVVFAGAFLLAMGTMAFMFVTYRDKMIAALLYSPEAAPAPVYEVAVRHMRVRPAPVARAYAPLAIAA